MSASVCVHLLILIRVVKNRCVMSASGIGNSDHDGAIRSDRVGVSEQAVTVPRSPEGRPGRYILRLGNQSK